MEPAHRKAILVILGRSDAIFAPLRNHDLPGNANFAIARKSFLESGLALRSTGGNSQQFSRLIDAVAAAGLITVRRVKKSRFPYIRPSGQAEAMARSMCGLPDIQSGWLSLRKIADLARAGRCQWVPEWVLADWDKPRGIKRGSDDEQELRIVQHMAAPALCRGWLESNSTASGHVAYRVGATGQVALDAEPPAEFAMNLFTEQAWQIYRAAFESQRGSLLSQKCDAPGDIGPIPLSTSDLNWKAEAQPC